MKIYIEDGQSVPSVMALKDDVASPSGYSEVTSIDGIEKYGLQAISDKTTGWFDKKCLREKLKTVVYTKMQVSHPSHVEDESKWNLLTSAEKSVAAHWLIVGNESFLLDVVNDSRYWISQAVIYRDWTQKARSSRLNTMEAIVYLRMNDLSYAKSVLAGLSQIAEDTAIDVDNITGALKSKVKVKRMTSMYIRGLESEEHDGEVAIVDYIDETPNTPFSDGRGFRGLDASKFRSGHTPDSVADELLTVIDGSY